MAKGYSFSLFSQDIWESLLTSSQVFLSFMVSAFWTNLSISKSKARAEKHCSVHLWGPVSFVPSRKCLLHLLKFDSFYKINSNVSSEHTSLPLPPPLIFCLPSCILHSP